MGERELKEFLVNKTLSKSCSADEDESKGIIVNENLPHSFSTDKDELKGIIVNGCSTEEDKSECAIKKKTQIMRLHMMC